jgi:N-acetylmuramoyl-L-alanine amidase
VSSNRSKGRGRRRLVTRAARWRIVAVAAVAALVLAAVAVGAVVRSQPYPVEGRVVVLDPGHFETRADTGAINLVDGVRLEERDVNWEVTLLLRSLLQEQGVIVVLTRQAGEFLDREARYEIANAARGDVLLSIHHNGVDDRRINYTTTFYTHDTDVPIARRVQDELVARLGFSDSGIRRETFGMTVHPAMPAALTEAWFITHDATARRYLAEDRARTTTVAGQGWADDSLVTQEAQALADAVVSYLRAYRPVRQGQ